MLFLAQFRASSVCYATPNVFSWILLSNRAVAGNIFYQGKSGRDWIGSAEKVSPSYWERSRILLMENLNFVHGIRRALQVPTVGSGAELRPQNNFGHIWNTEKRVWWQRFRFFWLSWRNSDSFHRSTLPNVYRGDCLGASYGPVKKSGGTEVLKCFKTCVALTFVHNDNQLIRTIDTNNTPRDFRLVQYGLAVCALFAYMQR